MNSNDRVYVLIQVAGVNWSLITSREMAERFRDNWKAIEESGKIGISGVVDHRDANEVEYILDRENIEGIMIQEVKV